MIRRGEKVFGGRLGDSFDSQWRAIEQLNVIAGNGIRVERTTNGSIVHLESSDEPLGGMDLFQIEDIFHKSANNAEGGFYATGLACHRVTAFDTKTQVAEFEMAGTEKLKYFVIPMSTMRLVAPLVTNRYFVPTGATYPPWPEYIPYNRGHYTFAVTIRSKFGFTSDDLTQKVTGGAVQFRIANNTTEQFSPPTETPASGYDYTDLTQHDIVPEGFMVGKAGGAGACYYEHIGRQANY